MLPNVASRKGILFTGHLAGVSAPQLLQQGDLGANGFGDIRFRYTAGANTPFVANRIVTGGTTGAKARVLREEGTVGGVTTMVAEIIGVGGVPGTFRPGEAITDNSDTPKSATLAEVAGVIATNAVIDYPVDLGVPRHLVAQLYNPKLNAAVPEDFSQNVFWYGAAKLGATLAVASTASINRWDVVVGATSGAKALVEAKSASQLTLTPYNATAWTAGENVNIVGGASGVTTVGAGSPYVTKTAGEWGPACVMPNLNGRGSQWETRPNGYNTRPNNVVPTLGLEHIATLRAYEQWGVDLRALRIDAAADAGISAGIVSNVLVVSAWTIANGTFVAGETITCAARSGWSAVVRWFDTVTKWIYLSDIVIGAGGHLQTGDTIVGGTSAASFTVTVGSGGRAVFGYQKGGIAFQRIVDQLAAALAKAGGDTIDFQWVVIAPPVDDYLTPSGAYGGADIKRAYGQFVADLRIALGATANPAACKISIQIPDVRFHAAAKPGNAAVMRAALIEFCNTQAGVAAFHGDGFEMAASSLSSTIPVDAPTYETSAYPQLGERAWRSYLGAIAPPVPSTMVSAPVIVFISNSQGHANFYTALVHDQNPEIAKLPASNPLVAGVPISTIDNRLQVWNELTHACEAMDISWNACGNWGVSTPGQFGLPVSLLPHIANRYNGPVYLLSMPFGGSSLEASAGSPGAWDPDGFTNQTVTASLTVTASNKRITGAVNTFADALVNQYAQVSGSALGAIGFGGNNTLRARPYRISAKAGDGSWIELDTSGLAMANEGPLTLTVTLGSANLKTAAEQTIREFMSWLVADGKVPRVVLTVTQHGENDTARSSTFYAKYSGLIAWLRQACGFRVGQEDVAPHAVIRTSNYNPSGTDAQLAEIQAAQDQLGTDVSRVLVVGKNQVTPHDHKAEFTVGGVKTWPRTSRSHYGIHLTPRCVQRLGDLIDIELTKAAYREIPANPKPPFVVGGSTGSGSESVGDSESTTGEVAGNLSASSSGIQEALEDAPDVASWTENGRSVVRRTPEQIAALDQIIAARKRRASGQGTSYMRFS